MPSAGQEGVIYSATYSNVPVYELNVNSNHVMRRRGDDWINATHILKVADLDKPARTRVLEKEVQQDIHEKVQGGYGKYQGTWIPQDKAESLAKKYNVYNILKPILVFKLGAGDKSPPPAPKHTTAASKAKPAKAAAPKKAATKLARVAAASLNTETPKPPVRREEYDYENISDELHDDDSPDNTTIASESVIDGEFSARKRKRDDEQFETSRSDQEHRMWADGLLDYFMLYEGDGSLQPLHYPEIPANINVNKPIDDDGHTALHWAAAMGDPPVVRELLNKGADVAARNIRGETPLIRAALFANCYDRATFTEMVHMLQSTIKLQDNHKGTILHHTAYTAMSSTRAKRAQHYLLVLLSKLHETNAVPTFHEFLNIQDRAGDTALHVAARLSKRCTKVLQQYGIATDIPNNNGETADYYLHRRASRARDSNIDILLQSSSPVQGDNTAGISPAKVNGNANMMLPVASYRTTSSKTFNRSLSGLMATHFNDFLQAGETDLADLDATLHNIEQVTAQKEAEIAALKAEGLKLEAMLEEDGLGDTAALEAEERRLIAEGEKLEEQIQHRRLKKLVFDEERSPLTQAAKEADEKLTKEEEHKKKLELVQLITIEQKKRRELTRSIVQAGADATMGPKGEVMKGIIAQTMAVKPETFLEDVDALLDHMENDKSGGTPGLEDSVDVMDVDGN